MTTKTEQNTSSPPEIYIEFCDASTETKTYKVGVVSHLLAIEEYQELIAQGHDTSIINMPPHIAKVTYREGPVEATEEFMCRCKKEALRDRTA